MAWNTAQQAAIDEARSNILGFDLSPFNEEQKEALMQAHRTMESQAQSVKAAQPQQYVDPFGNVFSDTPYAEPETESRGLGGTVADFTTGVAAAVPRAVGGVVSLGSLVPGVNVVADPLAEALMDAGDWVDERFLSDYQKNINTDMAQAMADSARQLDENSTISDHLDNIKSQGGAAAKFVVKNPLQALMLAGQAIPYLVGGGALARTANATVKGAQTLRGVQATGLTPGVAGAVGEGLMATGAVEAEIVGQLRDEGTTEYTTDRLAAIPAGAATSLIGLGGARINAKLGIADVDTAVAGQSVNLVAEAPKKGLVKGALTGGVSEGVEELLQSGSEQAFTNLGTGDPLSEDVGSSAVFGAAAGAPIGSVAGAFGNSGTDLNKEAAERDAQEQLLLEAEQTAEAQKVEDLRAQQEQAALTDQKQARRQVAAEFPLADYEKAQKAQQALDIDDPATELGQAFEAHLDTLPGTDGIDPAKIKKAKTKYLKGYQEGTAEALEQDYLAELDARVAALTQEPVDPNQLELDLGDTPAPAAGQTGQLNLDLGDTPTVSSESSTPDPEQERQREIDTPAQSRKDAIAQTERLFGPDWVQSGKYDDLASAINGKAFTRKKYAEALKAALNPQAVPEVGPDGMTPQGTYRSSYDTTERNNDKTPVNTLAEEAAQSLKDPKALKLSVAQDKIFKVLDDHFTGDKQNAIDEVYAGGKFLDTNIAELAGVKSKQHIATSIDRFKTKFLETQGLLKPRASKAEKDAAIAAYKERLRQEADEAKQAKIKASQEAATAEDTVDADISQTADTAEQNVDGSTTETVDRDPNSYLDEVSDDGEGSSSIFAEMGIDSTVASVGQGNYSGTSATNAGIPKSNAQSKQAYKAANEQERKAVAERNKLGRQQAKEAGTKFTPEKFKPIKDLTAKQIQEFAQKQTTSAEEVAAQAAEQNAKNLQRNIDSAMQEVDARMVFSEWDALKSDSTPAFAKVSKQDRYDWMMSVLEYQESNQSPEDLQLLTADLREIEQRLEETANDAQPTESNQGSAAQSAERTDEARAPPTGGQGQGSTVDSEAGADTSQDGETASVQGAAQTAPVVETKRKKRVVNKPADAPNVSTRTQTKFGIPPAPVQRASRTAFEQEVKKLTGSTTNMRIHVFDTEGEAIQAIEAGNVPDPDLQRLKKAKPYGWVVEDDNGVPHAHFILDRVSAGREKAAFLHEVGGHVGIDTIINPADQRDVASQIYDWADKNDDTLESQIARRAIARMDFANMRGGISDGAVISEAVAYFLEEASIAGVDPSVNTTVAKFVKKLRDLFITALEKIGFGETDTLTTQDIVDLAYGAARVELMHGVSEASVQNPMTTPSLTTARYGVINRDWVGDKLGGPNAVKAYDTAAEIAMKASTSLKFVHNIVRDNRESMPALGRWYDAMLKVETTRNEIKQSFQDIAKQARTLSSDRLVAVNKFLGESTFDQHWGYDPKEYHPDLFVGKKVEVNAVKKAQFDRMSDGEKQIVADIFAHGERMRQRKVALAKKLGVAGKFFTDASLEGPYAPLKRFGGYAGELKSGRLAEAERAANATGATKKQKELYEKLKSDRNHYVISFFDTMGSAKQFVDQNKNNYAFSQASERAPNLDSDRLSNPEVYEKVMGALAASTDASMDSGAKTAFREMVRGMYFQSMDERSARTSGAKRLNRAGYEANMMRSFLSHANSEASLIAQMENGTEVNTAFAEIENQTKLEENGNLRDPDKQRAFVSIAGHYRNTLTRNETPIQDQITTMNSVYMLLTSVGYHLTNATQPMMVSVPRIAGDFGNYGNAWSAMFRGYKYSRAAAKIGLNMETEIDLEKVPQEYRALLKNLQDRNLIDQGMEEDGSFDRFNTGFEALNRASDVLGTVTSKLYNVAKFVEAQNRISTAVAAYDVARANPTKLAAMRMTPEQYATAVVEDTQGNFSQLDAPLLIKSLPKVITQYRKYQLLMAWHYASAYKQVRWGSPEEKAAGARILAYSIGHAAMGAGATGVPLLTTAFWLATFLGDEDEPQDLERFIKEKIDDGAFGQALSRGVFSTFGLDLSTKLNQAKIFHPLPYVDFEAGEEGARNIIMGAVGPAGTTGVNFFRAAEYYGQGDLLKGIEYSMPKGIRSVAESYRLATDGMTTKSGTIVVDPRELDVGSLLINAMGLPASEINRLKWTKGQQYELEQYFNKESGKIRKKYIEATRNRDRDGQAEMRQEFRDLQKAKDRVRPFFNDAPGALKRQNISTLLRAPRAKDKLERREQEKLR